MNPTLSCRLRQLLVVTGIAALLSACSATRLLNTLVPESGFKVTQDIAYGTLARNKLDVYRPVDSTVAPALKPVVVFFYGGAWDSGDKGGYLFAAEALTSRGYMVVVPDYRLYPEITFPTYMDDAALAVKWTFDNIAQHGGDPGKIFTMGHSAGAQLAALVAFDATYLGRVGIDKRRIRGVVSLAGPMDFLPLTEEKMEYIFPLPVRAASQPINYITGKEPPTLLLHGTADTRVGIHNSRNLATRIAERGGTAEVTFYPDMGHVGILIALAAPLRSDKPVLDRVAKFIDEQVAAKR
ncbi:MAG: alpha/beta hydrolase [Burkholderiales bacterium]|nr:alpha/beta hydrolase [Burkholderiales bacterium]